MRFTLALLALALPFAAAAPAGDPGPAAWSYPELRTAQATTPVPPTPPVLRPPAASGLPPSEFAPAPVGPIDDGLPVRTVRTRGEAAGQQHWFSASLGAFQPFAFRLAVKVLPRENNSVWVEGYWGSVLFDVVYGLGVRVQRTAHTFAGGDRVMVSPGAGVHVIPDWEYWSHRGYDYQGTRRNPLVWVYGDVDVSWLHDFSPRFGFELGVKVGLAGRVSGRVGDDYPSALMFGKSLYPVFSVYSGFRF